LLYAIKFGYFGHLKFGVSDNPAGRLSDLQTGSPVKLELVAVAYWGDEFEPRIHKFLQETRLEGEWFEPDKARRCEYVIDCMRDAENGKRRFLDSYGEFLTELRARQAKERADSKLWARREQRLAWWMGHREGQRSRARYEFSLDKASGRWIKGPGHAVAGAGKGELDVMATVAAASY
jgi:hypothetical protein